jgi:hypothetical protein
MYTKTVATYYYDTDLLDSKSVFEIVACYDSNENYYNDNISYYEILDKTGYCVNSNTPTYNFPTWEFVRSYSRSRSET